MNHTDPPLAIGRYFDLLLEFHKRGYFGREFVEFAQLFISDHETIFIPENAPTWPSNKGYWVQGWFMVTPTMVERYRMCLEEDGRLEELPLVEGVTNRY